MKKIIYLIVLLFLMYGSVNANNIKVDNQPMLLQQDKVNNTVNISFDLSWENSWRVSTAPGNWDAAWIFAKYKMGSSNVWKHCKLSPNVADYNLENNNGINATIKPVSDSVGVYIYRTENGLGSINWDGVNLKWHYGSEPAFEDSIVIVKVFAIEMVYIPQGAFYVGDGSTGADVIGNLCDASNTANPYHITSENTINLGGTAVGNLGNNDNANRTGATNPNDDFSSILPVVSLPAAFPKGYKAFYCMKYEITQEQFVGFVNSLTRKQQDTLMKGFTATVNTFLVVAASPIRMAIKVKTKPASPSPMVYDLDLSGNNIYGESNDGHYLPLGAAAPYLIDAFADWSGLRMMTELEFEKACRGPNLPSVKETPWGTSNVYKPTALGNMGLTNEVVTAPIPSNCNIQKSLSAYDVNGVPVRVGVFATTTSNRENSGATYYGVMNMADNVFERVVSIGLSFGRIYTGVNGNGTLSVNGYADESGWIAKTYSTTNYSTGYGLKGGSCANMNNTFYISTRLNVNSGKNTDPQTQAPQAGRCVRTDN